MPKSKSAKRQNPVPHHYYHGGGAICAAQCGAGWLFDVRQTYLECGKADSLSETAQKRYWQTSLSSLLGLTVASKMQAEYFLNRQIPMILALGLVAFVFDTIGGVLVAKVYNLFAKQKINPTDRCSGHSLGIPDVGPCGEQDGPAGRQPELLLMHAVGVNVSGSDGVRDCGRYDSDVVCLRCI